MFGFTKRPLLLIAWKNLKTYPVRIFLTTSSIILGVSVIIAANIFSESNKNAFDNLFSGVFDHKDCHQEVYIRLKGHDQWMGIPQD